MLTATLMQDDSEPKDFSQPSDDTSGYVPDLGPGDFQLNTGSGSGSSGGGQSFPGDTSLQLQLDNQKKGFDFSAGSKSSSGSSSGGIWDAVKGIFTNIFTPGVQYGQGIPGYAPPPTTSFFQTTPFYILAGVAAIGVFVYATSSSKKSKGA